MYFLNVSASDRKIFLSKITHLAEAVEYTYCISADG